MSNCSAGREQKLRMWIVDAMMAWDALLRPYTFVNEELIPSAAGSAAGRGLSVVAPLWGCLGSRQLPHWRTYLLSMTNQHRYLRACSSCPNAELGFWKECSWKIGDKDIRGKYVDKSLQMVPECKDSCVAREVSRSGLQDLFC